MKRLLAASALLACMVLASAAEARDSATTISTVKAGVMPDADSPEEAAVCAAESGYISAVFEMAGDTKPDVQNALDDQASYWLSRAAAINGMTDLEYLASDDYLEAYLGLSDVEEEANMKIAVACAERIR